MPPTVLWAWILFCGASTGCLAHVDGTWIVVHSEERKGEEGCRKADGISRCQMSCPTPSPEQSQTVICFYIRWHNTKCTKSPQTAFVMLHQTIFLENHLFFWCKKLSVSSPGFETKCVGCSPYIDIHSTVCLLLSMDSCCSAKQSFPAEHMPLIYYVLNKIPVQTNGPTKLVPGAAYGINSLTTSRYLTSSVKGAAKLCNSCTVTSSRL